MAAQGTPVILIVADHWLMGRIATKRIRVLEILNDPNTDYLDIHEVQVFHRAGGKNLIDAVSDVVIPKQKLSLLVIPSDQHEAPETRRYAVVEKKVFPTFLGVAGCTVQGKLHVTMRRAESFHTLTHGVGEFFPITQATVCGDWMKPLEAPVAIANKSLLGFFYVGEAVPTPIRNNTASPRELERTTARTSTESELMTGLKEAAASRW